jgi:hypothetical protein
MWNRRHWWLRRFAAGLAFAGLVVVPTAQAHHLQISGGGSGAQSSADYNGYGYQQSPGVPLADQNNLGDARSFMATPTQVNTDIVRPDDRSVRISPQPVDSTNVIRPDDRGVRFTPSGGELPQVVAEPSTGFDWSDAGIGAGTALGLMLLALGAALATRHVNRKSLAGV